MVNFFVGKLPNDLPSYNGLFTSWFLTWWQDKQCCWAWCRDKQYCWAWWRDNQYCWAWWVICWYTYTLWFMRHASLEIDRQPWLDFLTCDCQTYLRWMTNTVVECCWHHIFIADRVRTPIDSVLYYMTFIHVRLPCVLLLVELAGLPIDSQAWMACVLSEIVVIIKPRQRTLTGFRTEI